MTPDVFAPTIDKMETPIQSVSDLVGEGKKFKTIEDLAKGKAESDQFIERLKAEQAELRAELAKKVNTEEQLAALRTEFEKLRGANPQPSREPTNPALTIDSVKALVAESITQADRNRTAQQNVVAANDAMVKQFGSLEKAAEIVKARASDIGMSMDELREIASRSPTAFIKIMGGEQTKSADPLNPNSAIREEAPKLPDQNALTPGTKPYYDKLLKEHPTQYWSPKVQQEIFKAAKAGTYSL